MPRMPSVPNRRLPFAMESLVRAGLIACGSLGRQRGPDPYRRRGRLPHHGRAERLAPWDTANKPAASDPPTLSFGKGYTGERADEALAGHTHKERPSERVQGVRGSATVQRSAAAFLAKPIPGSSMIFGRGQSPASSANARVAASSAATSAPTSVVVAQGCSSSRACRACA